MKVLTQGHWPKDGKEPVPQLVALPKEIATAMSAFTQFYFSKFNNGRQIHWKLSLGSAELRGNFHQKYEFLTSSYQMFLLMLFNDHQQVTYQQVMQITQIPAQDLQQHLIPLIKCKLLNKNPAVHSFTNEDVLTVNADYKSSLFRNKIPVMVSKQTKDKEGVRVQEKVEDFRRYEIEAAIIKVMKARRSIDH